MTNGGNFTLTYNERYELGRINLPNGLHHDRRYDWQSDGMLARVVRPDGKEVSFAYDALGRRIRKTYAGITTHFVWDGNVPLHEWTEENEVVTWLFEQDTFVPAAKLVANGDCFSIVSDYLGTPLQAYDKKDNKVWEQELDIYGRQRKRPSAFIPFKYQGQYEDAETGLYYNRFRYYDPNAGSYISQDPIGLMGGNPTLYGYVRDLNAWIDLLGLLGEEFDVGLHTELLRTKKDPNLRSHHVGQKAIMKDIVADYDEMKAPAILVDKTGHNVNKPGAEPGIVSRSRINPKNELSIY